MRWALLRTLSRMPSPKVGSSTTTDTDTEAILAAIGSTAAGSAREARRASGGAVFIRPTTGPPTRGPEYYSARPALGCLRAVARPKEGLHLTRSVTRSALDLRSSTVHPPQSAIGLAEFLVPPLSSPLTLSLPLPPLLLGFFLLSLFDQFSPGV